MDKTAQAQVIYVKDGDYSPMDVSQMTWGEALSTAGKASLVEAVILVGTFAIIGGFMYAFSKLVDEEEN